MLSPLWICVFQVNLTAISAVLYCNIQQTGIGRGADILLVPMKFYDRTQFELFGFNIEPAYSSIVSYWGQ